jgi:hypothetical protein
MHISIKVGLLDLLLLPSFGSTQSTSWDLIRPILTSLRVFGINTLYFLSQPSSLRINLVSR